MILRLLIAAMMVLAIAKFYLHDSKTGDLKPEQKIEQVQNQVDQITEQAEEKRKKALEEMGM